MNSGITQGTFMRKQKVPKATRQQQLESDEQAPSFFSPADFATGATVVFYGRPLVIIDADVFTREWHARTLGQPLAPRLDCPDDGYRNQRLRMEQPLLVRRQEQEVQRQQEQEQQEQDHAAGTPKPRKLLPYPQRDTKVLRFFCAYEDERQVGGRHHCVLYYYVGDETIEIKEAKEQGRHHFPNFLSRQQVLSESARVYQVEDLRCGGSIKVYGRHLLLLSCDASTVEWYAAKGISQKPLHVASSESADPPSKVTIVPPNGWGTDDDVYALGLKLEPGKYEDKHARLEKAQRGCKVLRFLVHLMRAAPTTSASTCNIKGSGDDRWEEDDTRDLVLNYFEFDSTISIYEPTVANSGVDGGLFLARGAYKKHISKRKKAETMASLGGSHSRFLRPTDFLLTAPPVTFEVGTTGARLFTLKTVGYDEYTRKILEEGGMIPVSGSSSSSSSLLSTSPLLSLPPGAVPPTVRVTLEKQAEAFVSAGLPVRAVFQAYDEAGTGTLAPAPFVALIRELEFQAKATPVARDELVALMVTFGSPANIDKETTPATGAGLTADDSSSGGICYDDYVDALSFCAPKTVLAQAKEAVGANQLSVEERLFKALAAAFLHGESHRAFLRKTFQQLDATNSGQLTMDDWFHALKIHNLTSLLTKSAASILLLTYDFSGTGHLSYRELCDAIFTLESEEGPLLPSTELQQPARSTSAGKKLEAPTVKKYLHDLTHTVLTCDGNLQRQLENAMQGFCSCFSRLARKRILRKIYTAFDTSPKSSARRGRITRQQFYAGIHETAAEFHIDFTEFDRDVLGQYLFPDPDVCLVSYEALLEALCSRNLQKLASVRQEGIDVAVHLADETSFEEVDGSRTRDFTGELKVVGMAPLFDYQRMRKRREIGRM